MARAKWGSEEWREQRRRAGEANRAKQLAKNPNYFKELSQKGLEAIKQRKAEKEHQLKDTN